jgi:hypothetical protein
MFSNCSCTCHCSGDNHICICNRVNNVAKILSQFINRITSHSSIFSLNLFSPTNDERYLDEIVSCAKNCSRSKEALIVIAIAKAPPSWVDGLFALVKKSKVNSAQSKMKRYLTKLELFRDKEIIVSRCI